MRAGDAAVAVLLQLESALRIVRDGNDVIIRANVRAARHSGCIQFVVFDALGGVKFLKRVQKLLSAVARTLQDRWERAWNIHRDLGDDLVHARRNHGVSCGSSSGVRLSGNICGSSCKDGCGHGWRGGR